MLPIILTRFVVNWIYDVYEQSYVFLAMLCYNAKQEYLRAPVVRHFMEYIVDFTIIMEVIFGLVVDARMRLSRRLIKLVFKAYSMSEEKYRVHKEIQEHVDLAGRFDRDVALAKITQLIKEYQMKPESMDKLQSALRTFENNEDEDWGLGKGIIPLRNPGTSRNPPS